jgi:hypothetical protein
MHNIDDYSSRLTIILKKSVDSDDMLNFYKELVLDVDNLRKSIHELQDKIKMLESK